MVKIARVTEQGPVRVSSVVSDGDVQRIVSNLQAGQYTYDGHYIAYAVYEDSTYIMRDIQSIQSRQMASKRKYAGVSLTQSIGPMIRQASFKVNM